MLKIKRHIIIEVILIFFILASIGIIYYSFYLYRSPVESISPAQLKAFQGKHALILIDVRESTEIEKFPSIPSFPTIHIPFSFIYKTGKTPVLDRHFHYVLLCSDGNRSRLVASQMSEEGLHVPYLTGGYFALTSFSKTSNP